MKKIKLLIIPIVLLLLCGCENATTLEIDTYVDKDTCVEYLTRYEGGVTVMYNADGTLKVNERCLNEKDN